MIKSLKIILGANIFIVFLLSIYLGYSYLYPRMIQDTGSETSSLSKKLGSWDLICQKELSSDGQSCAATRKIIDPESQQAIFIWTIGYNENGNFINVFRGGNRLKPGEPVIVEFEDKTLFSADNTVCDKRFCEYFLHMTKEFSKKFEENSNVSFQITPNQGDRIRITIQADNVQKIIKSIEKKV